MREVLAELHDGASGGHLGVNKTLDKVRGTTGFKQETILKSDSSALQQPRSICENSSHLIRGTGTEVYLPPCLSGIQPFHYRLDPFSLALGIEFLMLCDLQFGALPITPSLPIMGKDRLDFVRLDGV